MDNFGEEFVTSIASHTFFEIYRFYLIVHRILSYRKKCTFFSVNVFTTKVLIEHFFDVSCRSRDRHFTW